MSKYRVPMIEHTFRIIECFAGSEDELSLTEVSSRAKVGSTSTFRILYTLTELDYLFKNPVSGRYRLGAKMMQTAWRPMGKKKLAEIASPFMDFLLQQFNETVNLGALEGHEIFYVDIRESSRSFRMGASVGTGLAVHAAALGKAVAAFTSPEILEAMLSRCSWVRFTPRTITDQREWRASLPRIRKRGYALDKEETELGASCIATPILDGQRMAVGAISISGPSPRIIANKEQIIAELKRCSEKIALWL